MKSVVAGEFRVERRQQMPALTERDHRLGKAEAAVVVGGRGIREQGIGEARNDLDGGFVRRRKEFRDDLCKKKEKGA